MARKVIVVNGIPMLFEVDDDGAVTPVTEQIAGAASWDTLDGKPLTFPPDPHTHPIADVVGLQAALDNKAATFHSHAIYQVSGLQAALDGKQKTITVSTTAPTSPQEGDLWLDISNS